MKWQVDDEVRSNPTAPGWTACDGSIGTAPHQHRTASVSSGERVFAEVHDRQRATFTAPDGRRVLQTIETQTEDEWIWTPAGWRMHRTKILHSTETRENL